MTTLWGAAPSFLVLIRRQRSVWHSDAAQAIARAAKSLVAMFLAALLVCGPLSPTYAQSAAQNPPSTTGAQTPAPSATPSSSQAPVASLGLAKHNFTNGPRPFPEIWKPYQQIHVEQPLLTNSPRLTSSFVMANSHSAFRTPSSWLSKTAWTSPCNATTRG